LTAVPESSDTSREPNEQRFEAMARYIRERADELGLRDWRIHVKRHDYVGEAIVAHAVVTYGQRDMGITLGELFWGQDLEDQRVTVIHELLHAHLDGPMAVARDMEQQLGDFVFSVFIDNHKRTTELACDAIATAIAGHFPLP
jgi:hypothetical protein